MIYSKDGHLRNLVFHKALLCKSRLGLLYSLAILLFEISLSQSGISKLILSSILRCLNRPVMRKKVLQFMSISTMLLNPTLLQFLGMRLFQVDSRKRQSGSYTFLLLYSRKMMNFSLSLKIKKMRLDKKNWSVSNNFSKRFKNLPFTF